MSRHLIILVQVPCANSGWVAASAVPSLRLKKPTCAKAGAEELQKCLGPQSHQKLRQPCRIIFQQPLELLTQGAGEVHCLICSCEVCLPPLPTCPVSFFLGLINCCDILSLSSPCSWVSEILRAPPFTAVLWHSNNHWI